MDIPEHIATLRREGLCLAEAADAAGLDAPVPSCPGWVVRDLVRHQGGVHRWATSVVAGPRTGPWDVDLEEVVGGWPADTALLAWFGAGHAALVATLSGAAPDLECWTFLSAPSPLAMWARRQAHETTVHRVDAELASGRSSTPVSRSFAADGIDELLACFVTRAGRGPRSDPVRFLHVGCTDAKGDWTVQIGPEGAETFPIAADADCHVRGPAADLYLALWNRPGLGALDVEGDRRVLALFLDRAQIRWS